MVALGACLVAWVEPYLAALVGTLVAILVEAALVVVPAWAVQGMVAVVRPYSI